MVTVSSYAVRTRKDGTTFIALELTGGVPWGLFGHQPINGIDFLDSVVCAGIKVHGD